MAKLALLRQAGLSWQLARRYRATRHSNAFIRFISASSTIGIALGVAVLILALSVMNGFEQALKDRLLAVIPHVELQAVDAQIMDWPAKLQHLSQHPEVTASAPFIKSNGILRQGQQVKGAMIRGIELDAERQITNFEQYLTEGDIASLDGRSIVLGQGVADALSVRAGDQLQLMLPQFRPDGRLASSQTVVLTVTAIIQVGGQLDYQQVWVDSSALAGWLKMPTDSVHGFAFQLEDLFAAPRIARELGMLSDDYVYLQDWMRTQGHLYQDIQMVRTIVYLVLALVIGVACFNIVATLVMAVREKESDIAILLTMGLAPAAVIRTFMWLGWLNGLIGTLSGAVIGWLLSRYIEPIFVWSTELTGTSLLDPNIYFIDFVPSLFLWTDLVWTVLIALVLSLVATIYPAWRASKTLPAAVLGQK
ncbi:lipoprotein-releasing ABC transporter permease subunit [Alkalimonas collagenimarina]|uniref:Lipoprotein-releasing ABC transporter permease subunit n=1 Tax=Alkalimonas collagenimarina TaxID=400390 RepID=A0ABT9H0T5_9GAMM|nr:lipoprotein-releasing ABC transporter permease subunit [Alkalimonas collagenimarina]MDP4536931.1 lipoprotein-releasing ABC transporter permease subunit [Alkalimonas collagenimarina]